jgi:hypothetical protein
VLRTVDWGADRAAEYLDEVDVALYAAKAAGRNCVTVAMPATAPTVVAAEHPENAQRVR